MILPALFIPFSASGVALLYKEVLRQFFCMDITGGKATYTF
jgi:hypothetical protein